MFKNLLFVAKKIFYIKKIKKRLILSFFVRYLKT